MGWRDRDYSRDRGPGSGALLWLWSGSVPLFRVFGIDVRAHSILVITVVLGLLFGVGPGFGFADRLSSMIALFVIVLLHELGHCFACRWVGGDADQIVMHPLGGLAMCRPPHRPLPTFLTVFGGPAVNVVICLICGAFLLATIDRLPWNPFTFHPIYLRREAGDVMITLVRYAYWIYLMSLSLLVFNLLPIFPLDGGQMLQAVLWKPMGFYRSMKVSTEVGMAAGAAGVVLALTTGNFGLAILAGMGIYTCYVLRVQLLHNAPEQFEALSYAGAPDPSYAAPKKRKKPMLQGWRERREAAALVTEAADVDRILEKVARSGMNSLSGGEKRTLQRASENQRKRDAVKTRRY